MGVLRFIDAGFPLVVFVCPASLDLAGVEAMGSGFERLFARRSRYGLVVDCRAVRSIPDAVVRRAIVDWANRADVRRNTEACCAGSAQIFGNALVRGALTAIQWAWTSPVPLAYVADLDPALAFCLERLRAEGRAPEDAAPLVTAIREALATPP